LKSGKKATDALNSVYAAKPSPTFEAALELKPDYTEAAEDRQAAIEAKAAADTHR
jgi:hypothetical protein